MDHSELQKLVELMNENGLVELEIEQEGLRVSLRKAGAKGGEAPPVVWPIPQAGLPGVMPGAVAGAEAAAPESVAEPPGTRLVLSPMVGTFYRRPSPDTDPYVEVGERVDAETVVCIVEAMKVNNEIKAEMSGDVVEVMVEDGQPVEYDQPLFRVKVA